MRKYYTFLFLLLAGQHVVAQKASKKPLDHSVYDGWESVTSQKISPDGHWVLYSVTPQAGDARMVITSTRNGTVTTIPRAQQAEISSDSRLAVFTIKPFYQETRLAKIKKKKSDDMPKDSLGILVLGTEKVFKVPRVKSFRLPERSASVVAYQKEKEPADSTKKKTAAEPSATKREGSDLVLRRVSTGQETVFSNVTEYTLSENGKYLVFARVTPKKDTISQPGLFWYDIAKDAVRKISSGRGTYQNLTFDESGKQLAFTAEKGPEKAPVKMFSLYYFKPAQDSAGVLADQDTPGIPANWAVSGNGRVFFSRNGQKLFFGTAPVAAPKDTTLVDFEVAQVDVWNYQDDYLQPMQLRNLDRELKRSYIAVIHPENPAAKVIQLADEQLPEIDLADEGNAEYGLAATDVGNRIETQWLGSSHKDLYLVSTRDGSRKLITSRLRGTASLSPGGRFVAWYNRSDRSWYAYHITTGRQQQLTGSLKVAFYDELNDVPDDPSPYGVAGWTEGDQEVLIYDRYDIWSFNPSNGTRMNVTGGAGRRDQITFRYVDFTAERGFRRTSEHPINSRKALWLQAFDNRTKMNGWYKKSLKAKGGPELVVMAERSYSRPVMAKYASEFIYTKGNYQLSPDLYVSSDFRRETKLSAINPQQADYNWGTAELVKWTTPKGYHSEGILYKPEDFDPARKYPMVVYFYEKLSDGLFDYIAPAPTPSRLNISYFVSNGYLVFAPDISYEIGYPGRSAEEFINSGVESLKKNSWVDGSKIGIQGQSWGGYQVAHLITRTDMYAAAWAGAPVVNMTSAYGGIRWESGMNRQFQYERTQSRIGASLWEKPELYIENSPLFHLPKVNTPVVLMSNDADGAVPWYQGIEMFTALRRLNKPVWMLNYNGEAHNLMHRQNRKDIQVREQQFFDHFLKGKPAPAWMTKGVPATRKGRDWGFEVPEPATALN
ncbi:MAG TPA: prolyl oligopeptidase family serine peptidase [Sphingobacteriaceae bacterium]